MMRIAAERAATHGLDNIEFRKVVAKTLFFPGDTYHAVLCR